MQDTELFLFPQKYPSKGFKIAQKQPRISRSCICCLSNSMLNSSPLFSFPLLTTHKGARDNESLMTIKGGEEGD